MVHRLILSYDGRPFAGWQRQDNALSVQQVVEEALAEVLGARVRVTGSGRTDAGVHARGQVAHLELPRPFPAKGLVHAANHRLPPEVRLLAAHRMADGFHARKHALAKSYLYRLYRGRVVPPLDAPYVMAEGRRLDVGAVRRALAAVVGEHDFSAFALAGGSHGQPRRRVLAATVDEHGSELRLRFVGRGFLRGMVRSLVGTLVEIGRGARPASDMARLLEPGHERGDAGFTAEAGGLCLEWVVYPPCWRPLDGYAG